MAQDQRPVFIVGAPRSGTSLLRVTLNRHPAIHVCDETHFFYKVWVRRRAFGNPANLKVRRDIISKFLETRGVKALDLDRSALARALERDGTSYRDFFAALLREAARQRGKSRFGEKTPRHALFAETLCDWFPGCSLIHIVRDPRDVVASLKSVPFGGPDALANTRAWLTHVRGARRASGRRNYMEVQYERFVGEPEAELRRIMSFIGEDYSPSLLEAQEPRRDKAWYFQRADSALDPSRMGSYRGRLTDDEARVVEWAARDEMKELGYEAEARPAPLALRAAAAARAGVHEALKRAANLPTLWYYWVQKTDLAGEEAAWANREPSGPRRAGAAGIWTQASAAVASTPWARYAVAAALALLTVSLRMALEPVLSPGPSYFLYYPVIILTAYALGFGPALLGTAVSAVPAYVLFSHPVLGARHDTGEDVRLLLFVVMATAMAHAAAYVGQRLRELEPTRRA